jgi:hypothetical protein
MAAYGSVPPIGKQSKHSHMARTAAFVYDADEWQTYNGMDGTVRKYSYFTGLHTIALEGRRGMDEYPFYGREIMKARR